MLTVAARGEPPERFSRAASGAVSTFRDFKRVDNIIIGRNEVIPADVPLSQIEVNDALPPISGSSSGASGLASGSASMKPALQKQFCTHVAFTSVHDAFSIFKAEYKVTRSGRKANSPESNREQCQSAACTPCLDDSGFAREDDATSEYWDNFGIVEESLLGLSLETSVTTQPEEPIITGRRVVSLAHFVNAVRSLDDHSCPKLTGRFALVKERRVGLWSELTFTCSECQEIRKLTTDPVTEPTSLTDKANIEVNDAAVWAFMSIGSGHSQFKEAMAVMEIPAMSKGAFLHREESLGKCWKTVLLDQMIKAGKEEKKLAEEAGAFCEDGITPYITVIVDGGWSHRSHGHRYSPNSGVAVIIGERTKKLLYIGVRNKLCSTCEHYSRTGKGKKDHVCYKNWNQSSGAMESDIIVEGFQRSVEMHGVEYRTFIGDGDSCKDYFCDGTKGDNIYDSMPKVLQMKIVTAANIIAEKADRLVTDDTSNLAEAVMTLVAKLSGGKQINRCQKGSYEHRCYGAGLSFQLGPQWHCTTSKTVTCKRPAAVLKRYASKKTAQKANKESLRRKLFEENGHQQHKRKESTVNYSMIHYGPNCQQPDMPPEQYAEKERAVLASLQASRTKRNAESPVTTSEASRSTRASPARARAATGGASERDGGRSRG
ncbi:hypothetical protein HPB51_023389 [Rhipicephalus microplus]|uniref:Mutator-like transposase domain-containing protein n=1 Tax=Rhipicephalus microplus TaxID=6941 RepID=A0A9J6DKF8_RHIMP|nr:hypothetical protein HPB51_023389 [Rhipicephalus microplus]